MWPPSSFSALPPPIFESRLALKLFRGEPAISEFDWNFSPIHTSRGSFHLSLTVLCAIGHQNVFRLGGWSPRLPTGFLVSCGTLDPDRPLRISLTGFLPSLIPLPNGFCYPLQSFCQSTTPTDRSQSVWPLPLSLAATKGISVDFSSSGYLDVSVPRVSPA